MLTIYLIVPEICNLPRVQYNVMFSMAYNASLTTQQIISQPSNKKERVNYFELLKLSYGCFTLPIA
jgi:hypothetical protein